MSKLRSGRFVEMLQIAAIEIARPGRDVAAVEHVLQFGARARDAALHRADGATRKLRRVVVGIAISADEHERFALRRRQSREAAGNVAHAQMPFLLVADRRRGYARWVEGADTALPTFLVEIGVAENRRQPGEQIGAWTELIGVNERAQHGLLHEIVGEAAIAGEATRKALEAGKVLDDIIRKTCH